MPGVKDVIKGLECCGYSRFMDKCQDCPYDGKDCFKRLKTDALALLKAQETVVRRKDCKYWGTPFVQTMKDWRRMCKAQDDGTNRDVCATCPMGGIRDSCVAIYEGDMDYEHVEGVVTRWAKAHPEPVYPTWREYIEDLTHILMIDVIDDPIPADIAQKLGIEPKEG